jgi:ParB family chromosome partitioning protein
MFEEARAIRGMLTMKKMTQNEIAKLMGTSQSYVANKLRLLNFSDEVQGLIIDSKLTERHARALLRIKSEEDIINTVSKIRDMKLSVAASEALIEARLAEELPKQLKAISSSSGIARFEGILKESLANLRSLGIDVDYRTSSFGKTKYITIAVSE